MKVSAHTILAPLLVIIMLSTVLFITLDDGSPQLPDISTDISGTWELVERAANGSLGFSMTVQQDGWLITGELTDEDNVSVTPFVGVFINKEATVFMFDLGNETRSCLVYGMVDGNNLWLSTIGRDGGLFAFRDQYVRDGAAPLNMESFTLLDDEYTAVSTYQVSSTQHSNLTGQNLSIDNQTDGIVTGSMEQDVDGNITMRDFIAIGIYKDVDGEDNLAEYYIIMDEHLIWMTQHIPEFDYLALRTVGTSEFLEEQNQTAVAVRSYKGLNSTWNSTDYGSEYQNISGVWNTVFIEIVSTGDVMQTGRSVTMEIQMQIDDVFFGTMTAPDYLGLIGGFMYSPHDDKFFIGGPAVNNAVNMMYGWVEGDTIYLFSIFEENGSKVASTEIYQR